MSKVTYRLKDKNGKFVSPEYGRYEGILDECDLSDGTVVVQIKEIELTYQLTVTAKHSSILLPITLHQEHGGNKTALQGTGRHICNTLIEANFLTEIKCRVLAKVKDHE